MTVSAPRVSGSSWPRALGAYSREVGAWQPSAPPERATADVGLFQTAAVYIDPAERMPEAVGTQNITNKRHGFRDSHFRGFGCLDPPSFWSQSWNGLRLARATPARPGGVSGHRGPGKCTTQRLCLIFRGKRQLEGIRQQPITRDPDVMHDTPVFMFSGTRVPVKTLFQYLENGESLDDFLEGFPSVPRELAIQVLEESKELRLARV